MQRPQPTIYGPTRPGLRSKHTVSGHITPEGPRNATGTKREPGTSRRVSVALVFPELEPESYANQHDSKRGALRGKYATGNVVLRGNCGVQSGGLDAHHLVNFDYSDDDWRVSPSV